MIFILGIDALDYELVEKLNLNNLKQLDNNKIIVPINEEIGLPSSPEVWSSFLIGRHMSMNFRSSTRYINAIIKVKELLHIDFNKGIFQKIKDFFVKIYDFSAPTQLGSLNRETFLDITKSYEINVPFYNFNNKTFDVSYLFGKSKISLEQAINEIKSIYEKRKRQIFSEIKNIMNKDVVFAYMHTTDILQHLLFLHITEIEQHYIDLDYYVSILKSKLEDSFGDVVFIIVSDHGFDFNIGTHSEYGFYSSNINLIPKPEKITDFYGIILNIVNNSKKLYNS